MAMRAGADGEQHPGATASWRLMAKKGSCACHTFHTSLSVHANLKDVGKPGHRRPTGRRGKNCRRWTKRVQDAAAAEVLRAGLEMSGGDTEEEE